MFDDLREATSLGKQAHALGHDVSVQSVGSRFKIVCTCGWSTPANAKRKTAFAMATTHVREQVTAARDAANPPAPVKSRFIS